MRTERTRVDNPPSTHPIDASGAFRHEALLYNGESDFVDTVSAFIRDGLARDERVLAVVSSAKISLLREELGSDAENVAFADMADIGSNPARIIPAWYEFVGDDGASGGSIRGIGEPISNERSAAALAECQRHESLLNLAFADASPWWLLCPYDTSVLNDEVLEEALRSHPHFLEGGHHRHSEIYRDAEPINDAPLPPPATRPFELRFAIDHLTDVREATRRHADKHGLAPRRRDDLVVAVNELAINSLRHGGGTGVLRLWRERNMVMCEVWDRGRMDLPLAGRRRPVAGQEGGFGVWLVHQLCDLVQIRTFADGSVFRVHMAVPATAS